MIPEQSTANITSGKSTSARIYETLRQMILTQELKPGERLVEAKIASILHVSITPVRQAFSFLTAQGLLTAFPYRGTYVTILSRENATDLMNTRKVLEPVVATMAFSNLTSADAEYLTKLCELSDISIQMGNLVESIEYDVRFHEFFFEKSNSPLMLELWKVLRNRIIFFQCISRSKCQADVPSLVKRHEGIIQAVRNLDQAALTEAIVQHLETTLRLSALPDASQINYSDTES